MDVAELALVAEYERCARRQLALLQIQPRAYQQQPGRMPLVCCRGASQGSVGWGLLCF